MAETIDIKDTRTEMRKFLDANPNGRATLFGMKQFKEMDRATKIIFDIEKFEDIEKNIMSSIARVSVDDRNSIMSIIKEDATTNNRILGDDFTFEFFFRNYFLFRWYNFHGSKIGENKICTYPYVTKNPDKWDKLWDLMIYTIQYDVKTSVFPAYLNNNIEAAQADKDSLIRWLYRKQSGGAGDPESIRLHYANRLFIVCCDSTERHDHSSVKADVDLTENSIDAFMQQYTPENVKYLDITKKDGAIVRVATDIIFVIR